MNSTSEPHLVTDPALADIFTQLMRREPIFHRPEFGTTRADFQHMTTDDYWEVGASGRRYSRNYVLDILLQTAQRGRLLADIHLVPAQDTQNAQIHNMAANAARLEDCLPSRNHRPGHVAKPPKRP
jgi:hypothetical protein